MGSGNRTSAGVGCLVALVVGLLGVGIFVAVAPYLSTQLWWDLRASLFVVIPLVVVFVLGAIASVLWEDSPPMGAGVWLVTSAAALGAIGFWVLHEYQQDRYYASTIRVTTDPVPALAQRTPFNVSAAQVRSNLGEVPGDVDQTTYLPDLKKFTTPVERRGSFSGYQILLVQSISDTGRNTATQCAFSPGADRRFGGWFAHSLDRAINTQARWVNWDDEDVYSYCDDHNTPMIVVPLKEQDGWLIVTQRPAGLAVYDGATGQVTIHPNADGIPGPSYPLSLAAAQRRATTALTGFTDWWWGRSGWELPDDTDEINSGNTAEFVLADPTNHGAYATLLTGRGSATAVSAISITDAHLQGKGDQLAPLTVHRTTGWLSPAAILDRTHADFGDVFATQRTAQIFELAPTGADSWVVTIGLPQNMLYRVRGVGSLAQSPCLYHLDGQQIRCGPATNINGAGPGVAIGSLTQPGPAAAAPDSDLGRLSTPQLTDLIARANQEAARRLAQGGR